MPAQHSARTGAALPRTHPSAPDVSAPAPSAYHHGDLRRGLLDAAESLLERDGPAALSLREAARAAGVSHNAPYRHFADREALLAGLAADGFTRLEDAIAEAAAAVPASAAGVRAAGRAFIRFALTHPALYQLMFGPSVRHAAHPALAAVAASAFAAFGAACPPGRPPLARLRVWAGLHGVAALIVSGTLPAPLAEADRARLIDMVLEQDTPPAG